MTLSKTLKHLALSALTALGIGLSPALAAGTTPLALVPQLDLSGNIAAGCQLNFYVAGTVATPQNAYADFALTQPLSNPLSCDQSGRVPMHWLADGLIHIRLTTFDGTPIVDTTLQVLGPSSGGGGGGGGTVDPTTIISTGDLKVKYSTGVLAGFVRANGLTIGNATSGGTERANADTQALFIYLYNADPNLTVSGGRTGNALNDFNANKQLTLPDWRGRAIAALDDMGNTAAGRLTASYFGSAATVLGVSGGFESELLKLTEAPTGITSSGSMTAANATLIAPITGFGLTQFSANPGSVVFQAFSNGASISSSSVTSTGSVTSNNTGGQPHPIVMPVMLATVYLKL